MCTMRENWRKINKMVHSLLARFTIIDMTGPLFITNRVEGKDPERNVELSDGK
jgi:hypothetical protein